MRTLGLFGDVDASEVSDNPFYVAPDTYECVVTEANLVEVKNSEKVGLAIKWSIQDEDSEFHGNTIQDWKNIWSEVDQADKTPDMRKDESRLKQRLGEMGISESEMNDLLDNLDTLVGIEAYVTVKESRVEKDGEEKVYTNIVKVRIDE